MRDRETIDSELRRIALGRRSSREQGGLPSSREVDELLDELLAHNAGASVTTAVRAPATEVVPNTRPRGKIACPPRPRRDGVLRRLGRFPALPLSLIALA